MKYKIDHGYVKVNAVDFVIDEPNCKIVIIDLDTKRCEVTGYGSNEDDSEVTVFFSDLNNSNESINYTGITFFTGHNWSVFATISRYTLRIALYKKD